MIRILSFITILCFPLLGMANSQWTTISDWKKIGNYYIGEFSSQEIVSQCQKNPNNNIEFPPIIQGAHEVFLDGKLITTFGNPSFNSVGTYYGAPYVHCKHFQTGRELKWKTYSFVEGFAKFYFFPRLRKGRPLFFFNELIYVIATGVMVLLAIFTFVTFYRKISHQEVFSLFFSSIFYSVFFTICSSQYYDLKLSMLASHKISDFSLIIGCFLFFNVLRIEGYIHKYLFIINAITMAIGAILVLIGSNGNEIQLGTSLPFVTVLCSMLFIISKIIFNFRKVDRGNIFVGMSLCFTSMASIYDILATEGLVPPYFFYCIGAVAGILFVSLSVHEHIINTYDERDYLRKNLEQEVKIKTEELEEKNLVLENALENLNLKGAELQEKNIVLQNTLQDLHKKKAELIQSEKLACLGTLSAGIAHEINNSLNYVNGSLGPLTKQINKNEELSDKSREKMFVFIDMMKEGLESTFGIIRSLKNYTGLNQSAWKDVNVLEAIKSSATILQSRTKQGVEITLDVHPDHHFYGNMVGFGQILTNLMVNSIDAMEEKGKINIKSYADDEFVTIVFEDTGGGIPQDILKNVFDPFFTTKEVGKGTGLGLYIVNQEMQKHHGSIDIEVMENIGTKFKLKFPINDQSLKNQEAS